MSKNQSLSAQQYNILRAGHAQKLGFDINNLTVDEEHQLVESMAAAGILRQDIKALSGSEVNPSVGNIEVSVNEGVKSATAKKSRRGAASTASRDADINRVLTQTAQQWDLLGNLAADVAATAYSNAFDAKLTEFIVDVLPGSQYTGMSAADFLSRH
jgi:hypothetical protein